MQIKVSLKGVDKAILDLERKRKRIDPVLRGALNTTATKARAERYVKPLAKSMAGKRVRAAMKVKRARRGMMNARIIPSSAGVPVAHYKQWGVSKIYSPTRASIWVMGPNYKKTAAGFVNPASAHKLPLSTRAHKSGALQMAIGPSVAHWFKGLTGGQTYEWTEDFLQKEFERRIQKELNK